MVSTKSNILQQQKICRQEFSITDEHWTDRGKTRAFKKKRRQPFVAALFHGSGAISLDDNSRFHYYSHNQGLKTCLAVLVLQSASWQVFSDEERKDLEALANLTALAITRMHLALKAEQAKWLAESEKFHRALLNAVSHDLRTPLASITGAVTELLSEGDLHNTESRTTLLGTRREGALRMDRFVANLLDMARLESGILKPNREWYDITDIVGVVLKEVRDMLPEERLSIAVPGEVPLIRVDFSLIEQVLINFLENATKYPPRAREQDFHDRFNRPGRTEGRDRRLRFAYPGR